MPRQHKTKPFEIERSVHTRAPADEVMRRVTTPSTWPQWQSEISSVEGPERLTEGDVVEGRARLLGFDVRGKTTATSVSEHVFEEDVIVGVRMRIVYRTDPRSDGSVLTHHLKADLPTGIAGTVLSWLLAWRLRKMQSVLLERLRDQVEPEPS